MPDRCPKHDKPYSLPAGLTVESARNHPGFRYRLELGSQCELEEGHQERDGTPHRNGTLTWWDPPKLFVGGVPVG